MFSGLEEVFGLRWQRLGCAPSRAAVCWFSHFILGLDRVYLAEVRDAQAAGGAAPHKGPACFGRAASGR